MFVLSYVLPPAEGAAFGKATVLSPVRYTAHAAVAMSLVLQQRGQFTHTQAKRLALSLGRAETGTEWTEPQTGITFRIDPADQAPHACPCCGRLVLPTDHAYAHDEDAYCLGCFTWDRNTPQCLPENSAHSTREKS